MKFHGYKIDSTNIAHVEKILNDAKRIIKSAATEEYHRLLSDELNDLFTDITLGVCDRPNIPILDEAANRLNEKVQRAEAFGLGTEFDLRSGVSIMPSKEDKCTYLIFTSANPLLEEAFATTPGITEFTVDMDEPKDEAIAEGIQSERTKKWGALEKKYKDNPAIISAALTSQISIDKSLLRFDSISDRASKRARHHLLNNYLKIYSGGQQIAPSELMYYMDFAMSRLLSEVGEDDMRQVEAQLTNILTDITLELVTQDPSAPLPGKEDVCSGDSGC